MNELIQFTENGNKKYPQFVTESGDGYIRFADGTQMCWGTTPTQTFTDHTTYTAIFQKSFASSPQVFATAGNGGSGWAKFIIATAQASQTNVLITWWGTASSQTATSIFARWLAIGRWK